MITIRGGGGTGAGGQGGGHLAPEPAGTGGRCSGLGGGGAEQTVSAGGRGQRVGGEDDRRRRVTAALVREMLVVGELPAGPVRPVGAAQELHFGEHLQGAASVPDRVQGQRKLAGLGAG